MSKTNSVDVLVLPRHLVELKPVRCDKVGKVELLKRKYIYDINSHTNPLLANMISNFVIIGKNITMVIIYIND